jgi:hypothetical protein
MIKIFISILLRIKNLKIPNVRYAKYSKVFVFFISAESSNILHEKEVNNPQATSAIVPKIIPHL